MGLFKKLLGNDDAPSGADAPVNTRDPDVMIARLYQLKPGDTIAYMSRRWEVTGGLDYDEGGYTWREFHLSADDEQFASLSVDPKGTPKCIIWTYYDQLPPNPGASQVDIEGVTFKSNSHGTASFRAFGVVDAPPSGVIEYYDYHLHDRRRMVAFQRCNDHSWETYKGEAVELEYISITPKQG